MDGVVTQLPPSVKKQTNKHLYHLLQWDIMGWKLISKIMQNVEIQISIIFILKQLQPVYTLYGQFVITVS